MMRKNTCLLLCLFSLLWATSQAQDHTHTAWCGHDYVMQALENAHPGYRDIVNRNYDEARTHVSTNSREDIYTIPVVVHIVYQTPEENLSNERIETVIARLNEDYRRMNANAGDIRPVFADVVDDPFIEFNLVGVTRTETTATFELDILEILSGGSGLPDNVKQTAEGGVDAWATDSYLNIWVCKIEANALGSILGYAYAPSCAPNWPAGSSAPSPGLDGVVVHYEVFDIGTTIAGPAGGDLSVEGRTVTHEVGHYLGLRHIWGDSSNPFSTDPDCTTDDGLEDTPLMGANAGFVCDTTVNTCITDTLDLPDMFENYMNYADEGCMGSYTKDQIAVMRATLETCREGLLNGDPTPVTEATQLASAIRLSPNPTTGQIWLEGDFNSPTRIVLRDMLGRQISTQEVQGQNRIALDLSSEANGVYFVEIQQGTIRAAKKIVLAK